MLFQPGFQRHGIGNACHQQCACFISNGTGNPGQDMIGRVILNGCEENGLPFFRPDLFNQFLFFFNGEQRVTFRDHNYLGTLLLGFQITQISCRQVKVAGEKIAVFSQQYIKPGFNGPVLESIVQDNCCSVWPVM